MVSDHSHRIGFVFLSIFSIEGGIQSYVKDVLTAYAAQPTSPPADIYILRDQPTDRNPLALEDKFTFYYFGSYSANIGRLKLAWLILQNMRRRQYSRLVCGHMLLTPLLNPLCQWFDSALTVMTYGKEVWQAVPPRQQKALQQADTIWTISRYSRDLACQANDLNPDKFHMLPCVVDGDAFTPGPAKPPLVEQYGLHHHRVLMTVARLWSGDIYKGVDVTIRALPQILKSFPQVKYLVVGRGDDQPRLAQMAQDLGVGDRVVFAGFVSDEALVEHYRLADVYVMPSKEGFGIVYLEAMACGVPTLSGDDDGSADPLQDGKVGWRVPHRDPKAVAHACIEILQGQDQRCDGAWLRQQTLENFSPLSLQKAFKDLVMS